MKPVGRAPPSRAVFRIRVPLFNRIEFEKMKYDVPDEVEVVMVGWIIEVHLTLLLVVGGNFEGDDLELVHTWSH